MPNTILRTALAVCLAIPLSAQQAASVFNAAQVILGANDPAIEALFDLDGDPYPDAVGALFGTASGRIGIYRNDGGGHFVPVWSAPEGGSFGSSALLPGDFDGDGRRDDFVVSVANYLRVYYFDGVGPPTSVASQTPSPAGVIRDTEVADLDHDGRDDVITLSVDGNATPTLVTVATYLSAGVGVPPAVHLTTFAGIASRMRTAERSDGSFVTMVMTAGSAQIQPVAIRSGGTAFTLETPIVVAVNLNDPATGDLDGDGDEDIVLFGVPSQVGNYQVLRQDGGAFSAEPVRVGGPATALADVDGDGDLDGVCCGGGGGGPPLPNHRASNFEIAIFDPQLGFAPSFMIAGSGARHIAGAVDIDGDGDVDLLAGRALYRSAGTLDDDPFGSVSGPRFSTDGLLGSLRDVDDDGDVDIGGGPFGTHTNVDGNDFPGLPFASPIPQEFVNGISIGDFDGDADLDALVTVVAFGSPPVAPGVWNLRQTRPGHFEIGAFAFAPAPNQLAPSYAFRSLVRDLDVDGIPDLLITTDFGPGTSTNNDITSIYRGSQSGAFTFVGNLSVTVKAIETFDADGLPDLLVAQRTGTWGVCRNLGGVTFAAPLVLLTTTSVAFQDRPGVGDIDGDGDLDLALPEHPGSQVTGTVVVFLNDGAGAFHAQPRSAGMPDFGSFGERIVRLADVDGDRVLDLLMYPGRESYYATTILIGNGDGTFTERSTEVVTPEHVADLDGDGAADILRPFANAIIHARPDRAGGRGAFEQRGTGGLGSGGIAMSLGARGPFRADDTIELRVRSGLGGAIGALVIGTSGAWTLDALGTGQNLYVELFGAPTVAVPLILGGASGAAGAGSLTLPVSIPASVLGVELHHQVGAIDPATPLGVALSNGLRIRYGS